MYYTQEQENQFSSVLGIFEAGGGGQWNSCGVKKYSVCQPALRVIWIHSASCGKVLQFSCSLGPCYPRRHQPWSRGGQIRNMCPQTFLEQSWMTSCTATHYKPGADVGHFSITGELTCYKVNPEEKRSLETQRQNFDTIWLCDLHSTWRQPWTFRPISK